MPSGVGLAAPQIGLPISFVFWWIPRHFQMMKTLPEEEQDRA